MCESFGHGDRRDVSVAKLEGERRLRELRQWIAEDALRMAMGQSPVAHYRWRDEVIGRLSDLRPLIFRMPEVLAKHLLALGIVRQGILPKRKLLLLDGDEIVQIEPAPESSLFLAFVIVPARGKCFERPQAALTTSCAMLTAAR